MFLFQNLLRLNPKILNKARVVPTAVTKKEKAHWKRNSDKKCEVRLKTFSSYPKVSRDLKKIIA